MMKLWLSCGAAYGALAVALGAFGAHALRERLSEALLRAWHTGVEYQFYHSLALFAVVLLVHANLASAVWGNAAAACFVLGVLLFSGSLYALALTDIRLFGPVTPLGGLVMIAGWICFLLAVLRQP